MATSFGPTTGVTSPCVAPTASSDAAHAAADADVQEIVQLVNRFTISSVQFLNRFAAECESRLVEANRALEQLELHTQLLEYMLHSGGATAEDEEEEEDLADLNDDTVSHLEDEMEAEYDGIEGKASMAHGRRRRCRTRSVDDEEKEENMSTFSPRPSRRDGDEEGRGLPSLPFSAGSRGSRVPPLSPGAYHKGPSQPPPGAGRRAPATALQEASAARAATLAIVGAPVLTLTMLKDPPAPPPPLELRPGRLRMCRHPKLHGYFELLALRVPLDVVKAKMVKDGHHSEWLDTPDAPAPAGLSTAVRAFVEEPD